MKKWMRLPILALMVFLLTGCGEETTADMTTIVIQKDGTIEHTIVEEFGEGSADMLQSMMQEKVTAYNSSSSGEDVAVGSVEAEGDVVKVVMTYPDAEAFDGFMNMDVIAVDPALRAPFFYGTVEDAYMQGYELEIMLQSVGDEEILQGKNSLLAMGKNKIIIYDNEMNLGAPVQISMQEEPLYISDNVTIAGKKVVEVSGADKLAYILLEG